MSYDIGLAFALVHQRREIVPLFIFIGSGLMEKILSFFIDESGDFGFIKDASKYYLITLVFHDQKLNIASNIEKIKDKPVFHAGPIIRREPPFENTTIEERKRLFQSIFMFTMSLPINCKSFSYIKKEYNNDILKENHKLIVEYKDGEAWPYYNKNGIMIGMTNNEVRDYGKYFQIPIIIANNSMYPIEFEPNNITASLIDKKGNERILKVYSAAEYMKKVRRSQNWAMALNGLAEGLAVANAGYSSSTTNSSYSGYSSSYGSVSAYGSGGYAYGNYSGNSSYYGRSSSTTTSYNGAAAYQAQVIASNRIAAYDNALLSERAAKNEGYLKRTTIYPGETISGYINIERKKGVSMTINVDINGAIYTFPWNINH